MVATYFRFGRGRSRGAEYAEKNGLLPLSRVGTGKAVRGAAIIIGCSEWHHTGKYARATGYYDARAVRSLARALQQEGVDLAVARIASLRRARVERAALSAVERLYQVRVEAAKAERALYRLPPDSASAAEWRRFIAAARASATAILRALLYERTQSHGREGSILP